jgi:hypothetical protein
VGRSGEVCFAKASRQGVIAALIVESEATPLGGVVVESLGVTPVVHGRQRLRMRFAPPEAGRPRVFLLR